MQAFDCTNLPESDSAGSSDQDGDTVQKATTPGIVNLIEASKRIKPRFGVDFSLFMAPKSAYVQGGYATFGGYGVRI